ncbi:MAG: murein biosynthesis integral membrane protein MurJ [Betaproteobacteria bacterium]|nr:murein biosynthesis integral membrane protein MurJ [Betaproteobacteria bacterium]
MNLLKAASTVSLLTLASRVTGLAREWVVASQFGASAWTDAFNVAFRIPNLLRRLFAEGAFSQAFVPLLGEVKAREGDAATRALVDAVSTVMVVALLLTVAVGVVGAPILVWLMASGLAELDEAVLMTRLMFPYIGFMALVALAAGVLNTYQHFATPAATPVLLNLCVIGAGLWAGPLMARIGLHPVYALCLGVMAGGLLQLALQWPALSRLGMTPRLSISPSGLKAAWRHPGVARVLQQMAPAVLGVSVAQLSLLINTLIASYQGPGAISWLSYADRLMEFPTALLGVALSVVLLPQLSAAQAQGQAQRYAGLLDWGLRLVVVLALPSALALLLFAQPLVAVLFHYGAFTATDVSRTQDALMGYGVGLVGLIAVKILAPGFYARQDIRTPVRIAVFVLVLTQLMNAVLVPWIGVAGLALSIGLAALINATWLLVGLYRCGAWQPADGWGLYLLKVGVACGVLASVLVLGGRSVDWLAMQAQPWSRIGVLAMVVGAAAALYLGALAAMGVRWSSFRRAG